MRTRGHQRSTIAALACARMPTSRAVCGVRTVIRRGRTRASRAAACFEPATVPVAVLLSAPHWLDRSSGTLISSLSHCFHDTQNRNGTTVCPPHAPASQPSSPLLSLSALSCSPLSAVCCGGRRYVCAPPRCCWLPLRACTRRSRRRPRPKTPARPPPLPQSQQRRRRRPREQLVGTHYNSTTTRQSSEAHDGQWETECRGGCAAVGGCARAIWMLV